MSLIPKSRISARRIPAGSLLLLALSAGCGGSPSAPSTPAPSTPIVTPPVAVPPPVVVAPPPLPTRGPDFNLSFWNAFVHNRLEASGLLPLRRLTAAPRLYLRIVDDAGVQIDPVTLSTVENAMKEVAPIWGGGQFGLAGVERGTSLKDGQPGWLTVHWLATNVGEICGRSDVGVDGGVIELNYQNKGSNCTCPGINIRPRTARHELGHAFGYYHTDSIEDVMKSGALGCDALPSSRETYHATLAYQTPVGSLERVSTSRVID